MLSVPILASAGVYKCVDSSGKTKFSDRPCEDASGSDIELKEKPKKDTSTKPSDDAEQKKRQGLGTYIDRAHDISVKPKP